MTAMKKGSKTNAVLKPDTSESDGEVVSVNFIRVEAALRRYPIHQLQWGGKRAKLQRERGGKPPTSVTVHRNDGAGHQIFWCASYSEKYGTPGALAYRIDRLIIEKRIADYKDEIPEVLLLGSLCGICRELGQPQGGGNCNSVKRALQQNASTFIEASTGYKTRTDKKKTLYSIDAAFTRYSVVFKKNTLPNGEVSDAVYVVFNKLWLSMLRESKQRPLDFDYLRDLTPTAARLYEIISPRVFASLLRGGRNPEVRLLYSEFCESSTLVRNFTLRDIKKQMGRLHAPHLASSYFDNVSYEKREGAGEPDWMLVYTPGAKARREFAAAKKRGDVPRPAEVIEIAPPPPALTAEAQVLANELVAAEVEAVTARNLASDHAASAAIWLDVRRRGLLTADNPGAYLARVIAKETPPPAKYRKAIEGESRAVATPVTPVVLPLPPEQPKFDFSEMLNLTEDQIAEVIASMTEEERRALRICPPGGGVLYRATVHAAYRRQKGE